MSTNIGRRIDQQPVTVIGADRNGRLRARFAVHFVAANPPAVVAITIPLGKAAARSGTENSDFHELKLAS